MDVSHSRVCVMWLSDTSSLCKRSSGDIVSARALARWKEGAGLYILKQIWIENNNEYSALDAMSSRLNNCSQLMSSITYFIILWRKAKSRKTLFENSTLWSRFTMQIPQWLSSICFITNRYELWHVISLEKLQAEAPEYTRRSQEEVTTSPVFVQRYIDRKVHIGQQSGGIKLRGYKNLKIHLCPVLKLRNSDSDNQKRFNKKNWRSDGADVHRRAARSTPHFDIDGKLDLPARLAQRSRSIIQTWPGTTEFSLFNCWVLTWLWVIWFHNKLFKCVAPN